VQKFSLRRQQSADNNVAQLAFAVVSRAVQQSIGISCLLGPQQQTRRNG